MKRIKTFNEFVSVNEDEGTEQKLGVVKKEIAFSFDLSEYNKDIGVIEDTFTIAMSPDSTGVFSLGSDVEQFSGLKLEEAEAYDEKPDDAYIYGLCNMMNGGKDFYCFINAGRLLGDAKENGLWPALFEIISHEVGIHVTRKILTRAIAKNKYDIDCTDDKWVKNDYGNGEYNWPAMGDVFDKADPMIMINEEDFATIAGYLVKAAAPHFIEMFSEYAPELKTVIGK